MDENVFRIVVTGAVVLASLAFVVQALIMFALYRATRKTQENAERFMGKVEPVIAGAAPVIARAGRTLEKAGAIIERAGPLMDRMGPAIDEAGPAIKKAGQVLDEARTVAAKAGAFVERAAEVAENASLVIADARPQVKQISIEAMEMSRLSRERVAQLGELMQDAGDKARARLEQIDQGVDHTIEQAGQVGDAVKRAVMKPVREVNGVAAGVSAAVSTLMRGHRKSRVDSATQDEEMFI